jgi:hypothetical protein
MKNNQTNNDHQDNANTSLRGEAPQEHGAKTKRKGSAKTQAARQALCELSQEAKLIREAMLAKADSAEALGRASELTINEIFLGMYEGQTGCKTFNTFVGWRQAGYRVKKGETAFRIWGKPRQIKEANRETLQEKNSTVSDENTEAEGYEFWPMCSLFNEYQVEKAEPDPDTTEPPAPTRSESPFVTSDYQEQQDARKARYQARAERAQVESEVTFDAARDMASAIPLGQPILVGHHSERRDRRYRDRIHNTFGQAVALADKAQHYERKAGNTGRAGIASNDPQALEKLAAKLVKLEHLQTTMKRANQALKQGDEATLAELGFNAEQIAELQTPDYSGRLGFAAYQLQNNGAEIRRIKQRIKELEGLRNSSPLCFSNSDFSMAVDNGYVTVTFTAGKPTDSVRAVLKKAAFKWSKPRSAWVRKATANAVAEADRVLEQLQGIEALY